MKKLISFVFSLVVLFSAFSYSGSFTIGGTLGYSVVTDSLYKDIYGPSNLFYGAFIGIGVMKRLELRGEVDFFKDSGRTSLTGENTDFTSVPVAMGLRIKPINRKSLRPYVGAGMSLSFYNERARIGETSDSSLGFYFEGGSYFVIGEGFHLDFCVRYINSNAKSFDKTIKLGGINIGIGLGFTI